MDEFNNNQNNGTDNQPQSNYYYGYQSYQQPTYEQAVIPTPIELEPVRAKRKKTAAPWIAALVVTCMVAGGGGALIGVQLADNNGTANQPSVAATDTPNGAAATKSPEATSVVQSLPSGTQLTAAQIFERCNQGTVAISTEQNGRNVFGRSTTQSAAGSGFIISKDGYIITNHHVIAGANKVTVLLYDGTKYDAKVIGSDQQSDIAVLKVEANNLAALELGTSANIKVGDIVYAIGNPLGELANTLTNGIVSALDREITIDNDDGTANSLNLMQTNAAISPGNSGGPLINAYGQVIAVVNAKSVSSGVEGLGFAIPMDDAQEIINDIMKNGTVTTRASLNINAADFYEVRGNGQVTIPGAGVSSVVEGGAADKAGIKEDDIITAIDGKNIENKDALVKALRDYKVGDKVVLTVDRNKQELKITVELGAPMAAPEDESTSGGNDNGQQPPEINPDDPFGFFGG